MIPKELIERLQYKEPMSAYKAYELVFPNAPLLLGIDDVFDWEHPLFLITGISMQAKSKEEGFLVSEVEKFMAELKENPKLPRQKEFFLKGQIMSPKMEVAESGLILEKCHWKNWYLVDDFTQGRSN